MSTPSTPLGETPDETPRDILERIERELRDQDMGTVYSRLRRLENCVVDLVRVCLLQQRRIEELEDTHVLSE